MPERGDAISEAGTLEHLLATKEIAISCGSGGVGKTTTAAAAGAMAAVHLGGKVLVLTVDPARRLATALGLEQFGNVERRVPTELFHAAGVEPRGEVPVYPVRLHGGHRRGEVASRRAGHIRSSKSETSTKDQNPDDRNGSSG